MFKNNLNLIIEKEIQKQFEKSRIRGSGGSFSWLFIIDSEFVFEELVRRAYAEIPVMKQKVINFENKYEQNAIKRIIVFLQPARDKPNRASN